MIGFCGYCGTGFSESEKRCSYCNAPLPETSGTQRVDSFRFSYAAANQGDKLQDASLGLNESPKKNTCRRNLRGFLNLLFDTSLLEYVTS